jgi:hypothetical protein
MNRVQVTLTQNKLAIVLAGGSRLPVRSMVQQAEALGPSLKLPTKWARPAFTKS